MTLTELSNIFNQIAQNIPGINFYHFGFLSDINTSIQNNFQPSFDCADPYPLVMFEPPAGSYRTHDSKVFRTVRLLFADRQDSNKNGTTCNTLVEKMSDLENIALSFMRTLYSLKIEGACLQSSLRKQEAAFNLDAYAFNDRLVTYELTFSLVTPYSTNCLDLDLTTIDPEDIENIKCETFLNEYSIYYNAIDQYTEIPDSSLLSFGDGVTDSPLTFSFWIKPLSTGATQWILNKRAATNLEEYQITLANDGTLRLTLFSGTSTDFLLAASNSGAVSFGAWQNVIFTYNGNKTFSGINLYINGVNQPLTNGSAGSYTGMQNLGRSVVFGRQSWAFAGYYKGYMDELTFFNTQFDFSDVVELYNGGEPNDVTTHSKANFIVYGNRFGDGATFDKNWNFPDISGNGIASNSVNMEEVNRTTDIPTV